MKVVRVWRNKTGLQAWLCRRWDEAIRCVDRRKMRKRESGGAEVSARLSWYWLYLKN